MIRPILLCAATLLGQTGFVLPVQPTPASEARRRLAMSMPDPGTIDLGAVHSGRITRALRSPDALWAFVTSPEPMYLERRAAAHQAKGLVPIAWLPKVWQAVAELRRQQDQFGLKPHPMNSMMWIPGDRSLPRVPRRILGHEWTPPAEPLEYPLTLKEREAAPWPWQVLEALNDLKSGFIPSTLWASRARTKPTPICRLC